MRKKSAIALLCLMTLACHAQQTRSKLDSVQRVDEVVVVGNSVHSVLPSQQLQGEELQRMNSLNVADALRYFSGLQIKDYGGIGGLKTVNIHSLGTNHVGIFYDGIELGNAQNGQIDLGRFSLDNMDAITVYNGQRSDIFQSAKDFGSAGTVYMQSRTPYFEDGKRQNIKVAFKTGSFGTANPSVLFERKISDNLSASVSGEYMYTTGRYKFRYTTVGGYDTTAVRRNGDLNAFRVETGLFGRVGNDGSWKAKAYLYRSDRGLPGAVVRGKFSHEDRQDDTNFFLQSSFKKRVNRYYSLLVNGKYAYDYLHYISDPRRDESLMYINNHYRQQEFYVSTAHMFEAGCNWSFSAAVDYQFNSLRADLYNFAKPSRNTLLASLAANADYGRFKAQVSLLETYVNDRVKAGAEDMADKSELTPAVAVSLQPIKGQNLYLRAFYKRIFRMPTLNDLYYTFIGNINLKPEYTNQYNIGLTYDWNAKGLTWLRQISVKADAYYNTVENKIVAVPTSNQFRWTMMNLGEVEIRGVDASLATAWQIEKVIIDTRFSYTYQKAQDFTDPADAYYKDQIPYIPLHSASAVIDLSWKSWNLFYSFIYTGSRWDQRANIPENYAPEWYTSDISLSRDLVFGKHKFRITCEVNNIFNQQFEVVKGYPMPGTNFRIGLKYEI